ncbi:MAG: glycosyltransferase N-terminal domain-containing protein [Acidobacteriota bacterium]
MLAYRLLSVLALALYTPYALFRSLSGRRKIGDIAGRMGRRPYPDLDGGVWIHAVSVGEVGVAKNLLGELSRRAAGARLGLSVTTAAGTDVARRSAAGFPPGVAVFSFPLDLAGPVERALDGVRPGLILLTETEIWPLFLARARRRSIPVALVNGRLSERSFRRYRLAGAWLARVLDGVALFAMQTEADASRIRRLGAPSDRVFVTGNVKYDVGSPPPFADADRLREAARGRPVVAAASTGEGEEEMVLTAWSALPSGARPLLVLAPRRPERFDAVARMVERRGLPLLRRSRSDAPLVGAGTDVYLLDSIGELSSLYLETRLAFIGGSLIAAGGHNPIEAWAAGVPAVAGRHMENFREIAEAGERATILERVADADGLAAAFAAALADPAGTAARGERARGIVEESRGAGRRTVDRVLLLWDGRRERTAP